MKRRCTEQDLAEANLNVVKADVLAARVRGRIDELHWELHAAHEALGMLLELQRQLDRHRNKVIAALAPNVRQRLVRRFRVVRVSR